MKKIKKLYEIRFSSEQVKEKNFLWNILCKNFLQKFIKENSVVLDLATGYGEFINNIKASKKIAIDLNTSSQSHLKKDILFFNSDATKLKMIDDNSIDVCFSSNFFEHLPSKVHLDDLLNESFRVLKKGGVYLCIQPNIRYSSHLYWDYYDHLLPLSDRSCSEAFKKAGFNVECIIPKFLPWSTESIMPFKKLLLYIYLKLPFLWPIFGKQFFLLARK